MKVFTRVVFLASLLTVFTSANVVAEVVQIFWTVNSGPFTSGGKIQRSNPDGSGVIDLNNWLGSSHGTY